MNDGATIELARAGDRL